jgi:hypothetical protein
LEHIWVKAVEGGMVCFVIEMGEENDVGAVAVAVVVGTKVNPPALILVFLLMVVRYARGDDTVQMQPMQCSGEDGHEI